MKSLVKQTLLRFGYLICKLPRNLRGKIKSVEDYANAINKWDINSSSVHDSIKDYDLVKNNTMVPFEILASLYEQVKMIECLGVEGDFVECGVWKGGSVGMMALANLRYGIDRRHLHLFDSFQDICEPDPLIDGERAIQQAKMYAKRDRSTLRGELAPMEGFYDFLGGHGTVNDCYDLLKGALNYDEEYIHFYEGWFQDTFPRHSQKIKKISILRLDGDWYESTKVSLEYFYDKVQEGGIVIIDDYGSYEGCRKAVDEFLANRQLKKHLLKAWPRNGECYYLFK